MLICGSLHISGHRLLCSSKDLVKIFKTKHRKLEDLRENVSSVSPQFRFSPITAA